MSLINDMLKDLDERQSSQKIINVDSERARILRPVKSSRKSKAVGLAAGVAILSIGLGAYAYKAQWWPAEPGSAAPLYVTDTMEAADVQPPVLTRNDNPAAAATTGAVANIFHAVAESGESLEFELSKSVTHQILEDSPTQLQLLLPTTMLKTRLPSLAASQLIETVDIKQQGDDAILSLTYTVHSRAKTYLLSQDAGASLVIELAAIEPAERLAAARPASPARETDPEVLEVEDADHASPVGSTPVFAKSKPKLTPAQRDEQASQQAMQLARRGQMRLAVEQLHEFIAEAEHGLASRTMLAKLLLQSGDQKSALDLVLDSRLQQPDDLELQKLHARILLEQGLTEQALAVLNAISADKLDLEYMALRASLQQRTAAHADAIASYDQLLAHQGAHPPWLIGQAISLEAEGQADSARNNYQRALRVAGIDARLREYAIERLKQLN